MNWEDAEKIAVEWYEWLRDLELEAASKLGGWHRNRHWANWPSETKRLLVAMEENWEAIGVIFGAEVREGYAVRAVELHGIMRQGSKRNATRFARDLRCGRVMT